MGNTHYGIMLLINVNVPENKTARAKFISIYGDVKYICMVYYNSFGKSKLAFAYDDDSTGGIFVFGWPTLHEWYCSGNRFKMLFSFSFLFFKIQMIKWLGKINFQFKRVYRRRVWITYCCYFTLVKRWNLFCDVTLVLEEIDIFSSV